MTRTLRRHCTLMLSCALLALPRASSAQGRMVPGITFAVDTAWNGEIVADILSVLALRVTEAGGRGRVDVIARALRPAVQFRWVTFALSSAVPGDYFLFDSASVVHVRPATKTYARYPLTDVSYNYEGARDRWPFFRYDAHAPDTLPHDPRRTEGSRGGYSVFWHTELVKSPACNKPDFGACIVRELARGRADVLDAPAEALGVLRWLGPAQAIARLPELDSIVGAPVRVTGIGFWKAAQSDSVLHAGTIRLLSGLRRTMVDPALFVLPAGYAELPHGASVAPSP